MILIGNKALRENNKNLRAIVSKLYTIISEKDDEIERLKRDNLYTTFSDITNRLDSKDIEILGSALLEYSKNNKESDE